MKIQDLHRRWIPDFSLVHPSARPKEWAATRDRWIKAASPIADFEYVVCFDAGTDVTPEQAAPARLVWNHWTKCSVDATNVAAQCAIGKVLVVISDDIYPCDDWDQQLKNIPQLWSGEPCVVRVSTGCATDEGGLLTVQILNRERYEQVGYLFHPSYVSMWADDDFTQHAEMDGVVVEAKHILFSRGRGPISERRTDQVYRRQNDPARYDYGAAVLAYRKQTEFPRMMPQKLMDMRVNVY